MHALKRPLVSEEQFLAFPVSLDKVELVDGEVVLSPSPTFWHQTVVRRLATALSLWAEPTRGRFTVAVAPSDVRFGVDRILQPDLYVVEGRIPRDHAGPVDRIPVLCVEVLSTDRLYDRVTKRLVYAQAGVREYWVVEAAELVERWTGGDLDRAEEVRDLLTSPLLPGFSVRVPELFAE